MNLLGIVTGEQGAARGPATRGIVELRKTQTIGGQPVKVRRSDIRTITPEIGITEIIREDEDDVWFCWRISGSEDGCPRSERAQYESNEGEEGFHGAVTDLGWD